MNNNTIELFMPFASDISDAGGLLDIAACSRVERITLWRASEKETGALPPKTDVLSVTSLTDGALFADMAKRSAATYVVCCLKPLNPLPAIDALLHMCDSMEQGSAMLYCDYRKAVDGSLVDAPTIDYAPGSLRNDFDFGSVVVIRTAALKKCLCDILSPCLYAGFYRLRLALSRVGKLQRLPEFMYTEQEHDTRKSGEKQFDYVNPSQRDVQIEMEDVCTDHLQRIGGWLPPGRYKDVDLSQGDFPVEASVVIPVLNRVSTISDAIRSVLSQRTSFPFNILVVDNHSTDGTGAAVESFHDERVHHIVPNSTSLGIGGCWNLAVNSEHCGRFAVQLDSDDLYSDDNVLQRIVDEFYAQRCAMLVGSYRICDFNLNTLPPGVIDHREWSDDNGRNNALRINGLGAPRAFYTPVVRSVGFPNVSYGEDYAVGLQISRYYRIGRIYDVLYLCRRWDGNSDAALSHAKVNAHNVYKDSLRTAELAARMEYMAAVSLPDSSQLELFFRSQLEAWPEAAARFESLASVRTKKLDCGVTLQFNPARMVSTAADVAKAARGDRPCFLCSHNRLSQQSAIDTSLDIQVLVNPFPILPGHLTLPLRRHLPQELWRMYRSMLVLAGAWRGKALFYNGAHCGASAPDHAHLQAVNASDVPVLGVEWSERLYDDARPLLSQGGNSLWLSGSYVVPVFIVESADIDSSMELFGRLLAAMSVADGECEPRINVLACYREDAGWMTLLFPRASHRPACYHADGDARRMVSPGLLDMAGLVVTPRVEDFERMTSDETAAILREVALNNDDVEAIIQRL